MNTVMNSHHLPTASAKEMLPSFLDPQDGISGPGISLDIFESMLLKVKIQTQQVEKAQVALKAARSVLHEAMQELNQHTQRALAYAKVYAQSIEQSRHLEEIQLQAEIAG